MKAEELKEHLHYVDGIQKAQMIAIKALLRCVPDSKMIVGAYAAQLSANDENGLHPVQLEAMLAHLRALAE